MAPALHLALALLFSPTLILSDSLHVPLTHRRQTKLTVIGLTKQTRLNKRRLRRRYDYPTASATSESRCSNSREIAGIPMLDQVDIVIDSDIFFYQLITRMGCSF